MIFKPDVRREWFRSHADSQYIKDTGLTEADIVRIPDAEFLAIGWRVQNDEYLRILASHLHSRTVVYEALVSKPHLEIYEALKFIDLGLENQIGQFARASTNSEGGNNLLRRDARSEYFSVYRGKRFNPHSWQHALAPDELTLIDQHTRTLVQRFNLDRWIGSTPIDAQRGEHHHGR